MTLEVLAGVTPLYCVASGAEMVQGGLGSAKTR